jgi:hypothetical protein
MHILLLYLPFLFFSIHSSPASTYRHHATLASPPLLCRVRLCQPRLLCPSCCRFCYLSPLVMSCFLSQLSASSAMCISIAHPVPSSRLPRQFRPRHPPEGQHPPIRLDPLGPLVRSGPVRSTTRSFMIIHVLLLGPPNSLCRTARPCWWLPGRIHRGNRRFCTSMSL